MAEISSYRLALQQLRAAVTGRLPGEPGAPRLPANARAFAAWSSLLLLVLPFGIPLLAAYRLWWSEPLTDALHAGINVAVTLIFVFFIGSIMHLFGVLLLALTGRLVARILGIRESTEQR